MNKFVPMNLKQWRQTFTYDSFTTYSFHRGKLLEDFLEMQHVKISELKTRIGTARFMQQAELEAELELEERMLELSGIGLFNGGIIHPTAVRMRTYKPDSQEGRILNRILNDETPGSVKTLCVPLYRDAIVFERKDNPEKVILNICLQCMKLSDGTNSIDANMLVHTNLNHFIRDCGHDVDDTFVPQRTF